MELEILGYDDSRTLKRKRTEILAEARTLFIEQGIDSTSMQMIAEAASITRRSLYNYYESKEKIAVDIQILTLEEVSFFDTWNIFDNPDEKFRENVKAILADFRYQYVFINRFDTYFSKGYPDRKYVDYLQSEISKRYKGEINELENVLSNFDSTQVNLLIAYTLRIVIRAVRKSLKFDDVRDEVELICSLIA